MPYSTTWGRVCIGASVHARSETARRREVHPCHSRLLHAHAIIAEVSERESGRARDLTERASAVPLHADADDRAT